MVNRPHSSRPLEAILAGAAGAGLALAIGRIVDDWFGTAWVAPAAAATGAINGILSGSRGVYAWTEPTGVAAFALDSTWALPGTAAGVALNGVNSLIPASGYSDSYSYRKNRHVFARGLALRKSFATTLGNVVTNACLGRGDEVADHHELLELHEELHIWQQRWFGPIYQVGYAIWGIVGVAVGGVYGMLSRRRLQEGVKIWRLVETAAYYDNPFEYWAYRKQGRWETCGAHPALKWGTFRWPDG